FPVAADTVIYMGSMVAVNSSGYAVPAADAAGLTVVGVAFARADNTGGAAGDVSVIARRGVFGLALSAANAPTNADVGSVYVEDDQTVSTDGGVNSIAAGNLVGVDSDYAWVRI
ncbi:hypothetical protein, partial [Desulfovibrio inopinatus]|uniref:hypothetical protein n=1 Tax=Desulfovibrio inopinatus TaxID=102109 RepID=UPI0004876920